MNAEVSDHQVLQSQECRTVEWQPGVVPHRGIKTLDRCVAAGAGEHLVTESVGDLPVFEQDRALGMHGDTVVEVRS